MIKKYLLLYLLLLFAAPSIFAQEDRFSDINQTKGKDIYVLDNSALNMAFTVVDGKVKSVQKVKNLSGLSLAGKVYSVESNLYVYKKDTYLILKGEKETILLKESDAPLYLSSFVSKSYWQAKYDLYSKDYTFLDFKKYNQVHNASANIEYDDLSHIEWRKLDITDSGALYYMCEYKGSSPLNSFKVTSKFFEDSKDVVFIKKDEIRPYVEKHNARLARLKQEKETADSLANCKLRLAIALEDADYKDEDRDINVYKGDTLAIFTYVASEDKYIARHHYCNLSFLSDKIRFLDTEETTTEGKYSWERKTQKTSADANFLKAKGDDGKKQRFEVAVEYDRIHTDIWLGKLKAAIDDYRMDVAYKKKNQIFITGIGYKYDDNEYSHRYGMRFDIYNCFSKTIKYVEFTLTNYNAVGDVQRDDMGNYSKRVRGIGPIEPEDGGRYVWDDIFWDERSIISKTLLTNIKFIFKDGSTRVFSGYKNIKKHMTNDAWD